MKLALSEARKCRLDVPVGALIVVNDQIIATGFNQREESNDPLGHAELIAIKKASEVLSSWRLRDATLICTLEPCPMCAEAIIQTRINTLIFGAFDAASGAAGSAFNLLCNRKGLASPEVVGGIMEDECSGLLTQFFASKRIERDAQE